MSSEPAFNHAAPGGPAGQIESVAWAVFFIWVGIALFAALPWGGFILGVSVRVLGAQYARWRTGQPVEAFWLICGGLFLVTAFWSLFGLSTPLVPLLIILFGAWLLGKALLEARR